MSQIPHLGEFEYAVLLGILRLGEDAYAVPLRDVLEERTGRAVARGALYTALDRLEQKGCLRSRIGGSGSPERGGRPRRYLAVTPLGLRSLRTTHAAFGRLSAGLEGLLEQP
jgi:DNA-binding PadR family transcriptional regulator